MPKVTHAVHNPDSLRVVRQRLQDSLQRIDALADWLETCSDKTVRVTNQADLITSFKRLEAWVEAAYRARAAAINSQMSAAIESKPPVAKTTTPPPRESRGK